MTWEQAPEASGARRWMWLAAGIAALTVATVVVALPQQRSSGTLALAPSPTPEPQPTTSSPFDSSDFVPEALDPLETSSRRVGGGPLLPDAPDVTVVVADNQELRAINVATGDLISKRLMATGPTMGLDPWTLFAAGDRVLANDGDNVVQVAVDDLQRTRIARRHLALPTVDDAAVWMLGSRTSAVQHAVQLGFDGTVADQATLPAIAVPQLGTSDGVLVSSPGGIHIASGAGVRQITTSGQILAATGNQIAWLGCRGDLSCQFVIGTFDDPDQVRVPVGDSQVPPYIGPAFGHFSPDGRRLALPLYRAETGRGMVANGVTVIDTVAGTEIDRIQSRRGAAFSNIPMDWSPDGRWLFLGVNGGLSAWDSETGESTLIDDRGGALGVAVVPNGSTERAEDPRPRD